MTIRVFRRLMKAMALLVHPAWRRGLALGVGAAIEHRGALRSIDVGALIDVGANMGQFALAVRAIHPKARIVAFEPLQAPAATFARVFRNDPMTTLNVVAAGTEPAMSEINISSRVDSSSLLPISPRQVDLFPGTELASRQTIQVVRIDDVVDAAALPGPITIKLDVQGFELAALAGMPRLLEAAAHVYVEVSFVELYSGQPLAAEIVAYLAKRGFDLVGVYNLVATDAGAAIQSDFLFQRR